MKHDPATDARPVSDLFVEIMLAIALNQTDPKERAAMLEIMRKDGWLEGEAA